MINLNKEFEKDQVKHEQKRKEEHTEEYLLLEELYDTIAYVFGRKYTMIPQRNGMYRLKLVKDIDQFKKGSLGGLVSNEDNVSHSGNCWVTFDAKVLDDAKIKDNVLITDKAVVRQQSLITDNVMVGGQMAVAGNTYLGGEGIYCASEILFNFCEIVENENSN